MGIQTYKQYFPKDISCKMISGLKNANMEILDSLFDYENKQKSIAGDDCPDPCRNLLLCSAPGN